MKQTGSALIATMSQICQVLNTSTECIKVTYLPSSFPNADLIKSTISDCEAAVLELASLDAAATAGLSGLQENGSFVKQSQARTSISGDEKKLVTGDCGGITLLPRSSLVRRPGSRSSRMVPPRKPGPRVGAERSGEAASAAVSLEQAWQAERAQRGRCGRQSGSG